MAANGTQFHFVVLINDFRALQQFPPQNEQKSGADRKRTAEGKVKGASGEMFPFSIRLRRSSQVH